ncbi:hypothetical protein HDU81_007883 [Chytriomyces hyalinus]|nr:hypothetical protein HDU81_007883 [Chytriomyces hyalinus]
MNRASARSTHSLMSSSQSQSSVRASTTDESGLRDLPRALPNHSHRSMKGSLGSLYSLERQRQRISQELGGSASALNEWNYVMGGSSDRSSVPSVAGFDRGSISGLSYATRKTGRGFREPTFQGVFRPKLIKRENSEIYAVKFSPNDEYIAAASGSSFIQMYSTNSNEMVRTLVAPSELGKDILPCTNVCFRPESNGYTNKNVLVAGYADGRIIHWHYTSGQIISTIQEEDIQINGLSYQAGYNDGPGQYFAACGSDKTVRIYDAQNHKKMLDMTGGQGFVSAGHSNRVFAVKFHPSDQHMLISGGWDNTIQFWDTRVGHSVRSIYGPHICGSDALDINAPGTEILSASFAKTDQLQTWDFATGALLETIPWSIMEGEKKSSLLYSASFGKSRGGQQYIIAGGCGSNNEIKMFNVQTGRAIGVVQGFTHSVYSVALSNNERMVAAGGAFKAVYSYDVDYSQQTNELIY